MEDIKSSEAFDAYRGKNEVDGNESNECEPASDDLESEHARTRGVASYSRVRVPDVSIGVNA